MASNNTVEYRATLDASGVKAGAAEASQALAGIGADGLKPASAGLDSATHGAQELAKAATSATQAVDKLGAEGVQAGAGLVSGMTQASKGMGDFEKQTKGAKQEVNSFSTQGARQQLNHMGLTAGETAQAMRYLPMQMTDVAVSLASGMPAYMVAIQQGGQLKDSFNGIGNAAKASAGYLLGAISPLTLVGAAVGLAGLAYYQGSKEMDLYNRSVILSGQSAGVSATQLAEMARQVDTVTGTQAAAAPVLAQMASSGKIAGESLAEFTTMALRMEDVGGKAISTTVQELEALGKKPTEASAKLQEQYNYLTPAVYRQIKALEDLGKVEEAAALAQKTYANAMSERAKQLDGELGYIERGWRAIKSTAAEAWDAMLNLGRPTTVADKAQTQITALEKELARRKENNERLGIKDGQATRDLELQLENAKGLRQSVLSVEQATGEALARANKERQTGIDLINDSSKYTSKQAQKTQELAAAAGKYVGYIKDLKDSGQIAEAAKAQKAYDQLVTGINEKFKSGAKGGIKVTDNELANMQGQLQAAKDYYEQLMTLGSGAKELNSAERDSLIIGEQIKRTTDAKVIAKLQEKQAMADTLGVQLRTNEGLEQSFASHAKVIETVNAEADAINNQAQRQEAANQAYGKGKTAIEQMTLAELQKQMAEAQASDSFDPKYIAGLELKIAAQKSFVDALGQADYKAVNQHTEQLLNNAKALGAVYDDELSLSGKTGLERAKIAALRQVELKYARELAKIDATNLSDTEKQAQRIRVVEAQGIESAAAVAKATSEYMANTSADINRGLTDALLGGFKSGEGFAKNLGKSVMDMFDRMVLRPTISFIVQPFSTAINAVIQGALGTVGLGGGGGSNIFSLASSGYDLYSGNGMAGQALNYGKGLLGYGSAPWGTAGVQASGAVTTPVTGGLGGAAPGSGSWLSSVNWGAAAAMAIPFIAAYLGGMFKEEKMVGQGLTGELGGDMYGYQLMRESGGLFDGPNYRYLVAEKEIKKTRDEIEALKADDQYTQLGEKGEALRDHKLQRLYTRLEYLERDYGAAVDGSRQPIKILQDAYGNIREDVATKAETLGLDGEAVRKMKVSLGLDEIHPDTGGLGLELTGLSQQEASAKIEEALKTANEELARSLLGSYQEVTREVTSMVWENVQVATDGDTEQWRRVGHEVTETVTEMVWVMSEYVREGETATQALDRMANGLSVVNQAFDLLGATALEASLASGDWASKLVESLGGLDKFSQAVNTYYDLYYSDDEKRDRVISSANKGMEEKGLDLRVSDKDAKIRYRALVDKAIADKDAELVAWLLQFGDDFAAGADAATAAVKNGAEQIAGAREATLSSIGLSMEGLTKGFIQEVNEGRGSTAGAWLADQITAGFEQSVYERGVYAILSTMIDGMVTPMVTAMATGAAVSDAVSGAAISNMVANANAALSALNAILSSVEFQEGMEQLKVTITSLGNSVGASIPRMSTYRSSVVSSGSAADYASSKIDKAADAAKRLADEWKQTIEQMVDTVRGVRGDAAGEGQDGLAYWRAQLAIDTAAAKSGDKEAADRLVGIVQKLTELESSNAATWLDNQRAQAQLAQGLEDTARFLAKQYGITIPGFASGGMHTGGLRIVGENGPELELTGPSRIMNNQQLEGLFASGSGDDNHALINTVSRMHTDLLGAQRANNKFLLEMLRLFESWDRRGMPPVRAQMVTA